MSRVILKNIAIEGFSSILKPTTFNLDRGGIWFVKGINGAGKTTLFSAVCWVLYKVNLKNTNNDKVPSWLRIRDNTFRGTRVAIEFSVDDTDYLIARHIKFKGTTRGLEGGSGLMIFAKPSNSDRVFIQSDLLGEEHYKNDQQVFINKLLGVDSQAFLSSVLFGQRMKRLIEADNADKRKLFETLFELDFIAEMRKKANDDFTKTDKEVALKQSEYDLKTKEHANLELHLENQQDLSDDITKKHEDRLNAILDALKLAEEAENAAKGKLTTKQELAKSYKETKLKEIKDTLEETKTNRNSTKEKISEFKVTFQDNVSSKYNKQQEDLNKEVDTCKLNKNTAITSLEEKIKIAKNKLDLKNEEFETLKTTKNNYNRSLVDFDNEIRTVTGNIDKLGKSIDSIDTKCPTCEQDIPKSKIEQSKKNINDKIASEKLVLRQLEVSKDKVKKDFDKAESDLTLLQELITKYKSNWDALNLELEGEKKKDYGLLDVQKKLDKLLEDKERDLVITTNPEYLKLNEKLTNLEASVTKLNGEYTTLEAANLKFKEAKDELPLLENILNNASNRVTTLKDEHKKVSEEVLTVIDLKSIEESIAKSTKDLKATEQLLQQKRDELERIKWWLGIGLGASGIKAYVFSAMLNELNATADKYSSRLGLRVKFSVDLTKASKPFTTTCYKGTHEIMYEELSGGQKQRIDIVMALALHDIIARNSNMNILIFDEAFEGLDEEGRSIVLDLIHQKTIDKTVYVISHSDVFDAQGVKYITISQDENERTFID